MRRYWNSTAFEADPSLRFGMTDFFVRAERLRGGSGCAAAERLRDRLRDVGFVSQAAAEPPRYETGSVAPPVLGGLLCEGYPALTGRANLCRAYGAGLCGVTERLTSAAEAAR